MILLANWCAKAGILQSIYIIKTVIKIICIVAPAIIVITGIKSFFDATIGSKEVKDSVKLLISKFIIGAFIVFIPLLITAVIGLVSNGKYEKSFKSCYDNANPATINEYKAKEKTEAEKKSAEKKAQGEKNRQENKKRQEAAKKEADKENEKAQREKEKNSSDGNSGASSSTGNVGNVNNDNVSGVLYIGDSRTVGMYYTVHGGSYSSSINVTNGNERWLAKVAMGYNWFSTTAVPYIKSYVSKGNYTVTIQMGTNDLYNTGLANSYVQSIKNLASAYPNSNFVIISVNPINDSKAKSSGYQVNNTEVINFNKTFYNAISNSGYNNISYCDVYGKIINNYSTSDGIHYDNTTNNKIYSLIRSCI